jgi:hypothetical protein
VAVTAALGSGNVTGRGAGVGPDSNSGTTNTISTTKIDAPTKRCLT